MWFGCRQCKDVDFCGFGSGEARVSHALFAT